MSKVSFQAFVMFIILLTFKKLAVMKMIYINGVSWCERVVWIRFIQSSYFWAFTCVLRVFIQMASWKWWWKILICNWHLFRPPYDLVIVLVFIMCNLIWFITSHRQYVIMYKWKKNIFITLRVKYWYTDAYFAPQIYAQNTFDIHISCMNISTGINERI